MTFISESHCIGKSIRSDVCSTLNFPEWCSC